MARGVVEEMDDGPYEAQVEQEARAHLEQSASVVEGFVEEGGEAQDGVCFKKVHGCSDCWRVAIL